MIRAQSRFRFGAYTVASIIGARYVPLSDSDKIVAATLAAAKATAAGATTAEDYIAEYQAFL
jgi:hypothetical protein